MRTYAGEGIVFGTKFAVLGHSPELNTPCKMVFEGITHVGYVFGYFSGGFIFKSERIEE